MSLSPPTPGRNSRRLLLAVVLLLCLVNLLILLASALLHHPQGRQFSKAEPGAEAARPALATNPPAPPVPATPSPKPATAARAGLQKILPYGSGQGQLGMIIGQQQSPVGPESFAVTRNGDILVADVVNQRVAVYSTNGTYLRSLSLPGIALGDVMTDDQGRIYVYDQVRRALHQLDAEGTPRATLQLNPADIDTRGYFHIAANAVYFADAAARDVLVATLQEGVLTPPDPASKRKSDGIHGDSGRVYSVSMDKGQALRLQLEDPSASQSLLVAVPGIVSSRFVGEDQARCFYVQTERLDGADIVLEVLSFSPNGRPLATLRMPQNDYVIWTAKLLDVRADATIVQFLPERDQAKLNLFTH